MGYGTGAIMAVPGQDERDWDFAEAFGLPIVRTVQPPEGWEGEAVHRRGAGHQQPTRFLDGLGVAEAKAHASSTGWRSEGSATAPSPTSCATGCSAGSATGASRSRSSTTRTACPIACPSELPGAAARGRRLLARARSPIDDDTSRAGAAARRGPTSGSRSTLDLGDGPKAYRRETNTMPQWAGSCWY